MSFSDEPNHPIEIFYVYSHKDEKLRNQLKVHLSALRHKALIIHWCDRELRAGEDWKQEIANHLNTAQIILLLVSPDFLNSGFCDSIEMQKALERQKCGDALVIPIILRPVLWQNTPIGGLKALPKDAKPITKWRNRDEAFYDVAEHLQNIISKHFSSSFSKNSRDNYMSFKYKHLKRTHEAVVQCKLFPLLKEHTLKYTFNWHPFWGDRF